jgi:membrane associated rhomboid family serine protease
MLFPYRVDVLFPRVPWANWLLIALCVAGFLIEQALPEEILNLLVLETWDPAGLLGHLFLHVNLWHLAANMLFLWVFGNAVCARIGNGTYLAAYFACGLAAAAIHLLMDGSPAVGASGAINGVVGLYLVLYPRNEICCAYLIFLKPGVFEISGFWLILLWFLMDMLGALLGTAGDVAYWAHLGGFFGGMGCGAFLLLFHKVTFDRADLPHLLELLFPTRFRTQSEPKAAIPQSEPEPAFYLYSSEQQLGPYPLPAIRQLLKTEQIMPTDYIFDPILQTWRPLREFLLYK